MWSAVWCAVWCAFLLLATAGAAPASAAAGAPATDRPVVGTDRGPVRGRAHGTYRTFEGIPFAAPPTGPLRWRLPQPAARWTGVRDAGAPGARCVQLPPVGPGGPSGSEDCLYLNVTSPNASSSGGQRRPVMVWFHGGGFVNGAGDLYRPGQLAVQGGAVVVTVNYRLGIFGLFGHPALGGAPGFAIADQQAALRWVRANAARFGGDPSNVTLFGESAGGLSVCAHLTSPASGGLFQRAILQSGSCSTTMPPRSLLPTLGRYEPFVSEQRTVADGVAAAAALGCDRPEPGAVVDCLRGRDTATLATPELMQRFSFVSYGNRLLPEEPRRALEGGRFHRVPVVEGSTRDEMRIFLAQSLAAYPIPDAGAYRARVEQSFGAAAVPAVEAQYPVAAYPTPALAWAAVLSDASFTCPALRDGRAVARHVPVYAYRFSDRDAPNFTGLPEVEGFPYGASHGFELPYLFTMDAALTAPQRELSQRMTGDWTAFARTGKPLAAWPRFGSTGSVLSLAPGPDGIHVVNGPAEHHCAFWDAQWP
ncbi:carboxylesterase family protein [Streptomyces sp. A1547]|uniref:carboxylesterase/lipase family protein n=1 Tax=Streptomyces sp. A1547 TaxID=2563105 RepID=UPI00109E4EBA|nr:carboxylesterase family protein [Streptomyces sp. A1547]THA40142.1 carboxylesterase family protein [Streptomyces sp. A1547]